MSGYYVYVHIVPNDKYYIGITKCFPTKRWKNGYGYGSSPYFYNAILKYGWDNIKHIILLENLSKEMACECEKYLIAKFNTTNRKYGYNVCIGGEGTNGYHHTEEYKTKLHNRPITKEQRAAISNTLRQRWEEGYFKNTGSNLKGKSPWNKGLTKDDPIISKSCRKVGEFHHKDSSKIKMSESHKGLPAYNRKRVKCVETGIVYNSVTEAQGITGINNISLSARRSDRTAGGFHWRYLDDNI